MTEKDLGPRIAALRAAKGITGEQLGEVVGLTKSQVSKIENGTRSVEVSEAALIAEVLEVTLPELLGTQRDDALALSARVMSAPGPAEAVPARRRVRQVLESEAALRATTGLRPASMSPAGQAVLDRIRHESLTSMPPRRAGEGLAAIVREELGLGRAPVADLAVLCERHFGLNAVTWPTGKAVSSLCAHGADVALMLVSSSFPRGHQRFTGAHELAHHILADPRVVIFESDMFDTNAPAETRANAFAAALLMPTDALREATADRPIDETVLSELMHEFDVSYRALLYRLADPSVSQLTPAQRDAWLAQPPTRVLGIAGDPHPQELTNPDEIRRVPPRLWTAARQGYQNGRVGLGVLASLLDEDADTLYTRLASNGIVPPAVQDDLTDL